MSSIHVGLPMAVLLLLASLPIGCSRSSSGNPKSNSSTVSNSPKVLPIQHKPLRDGSYSGGAERASIMLRSETESSDILLIRATAQSMDGVDPRDGSPSSTTPNYRSTVFCRYKPGAADLEIIAEGDWNSATTKAIDCDGYADERPFELNSHTDTLRYKGAVVKAAGQTVLHLTASPTGELVAVYSGEGKPGYSFSIWLGKGIVPGRRFHQFFSKIDGKPRGETIIIPDTPEKDAYGPCWSPDGRYVVYWGLDAQFVRIIPVNEKKDEKP